MLKRAAEGASAGLVCEVAVLRPLVASGDGADSDGDAVPVVYAAPVRIIVSVLNKRKER